MNLDNIKPGDEFKNYKYLCDALSVECKSGNQKKAQLNEWERYFSFVKIGHRIKIKEVYSQPKPKKDRRTNGNNSSEHIKHIEKLIIDLLHQDKNEGELFIPKNILYRELQMTNANYMIGKRKPLKLSKITNVSKEEINEFYTLTDGMLQRNVEAALKRLRSKALIMWSNSLTVGFIKTEASLNDYGHIKAREYKDFDKYGDELYHYMSDVHEKTIHRKATDEEIKLILSTERDLLRDYQCESIAEVYKKGLQDKFYKEVHEILFDKANIYLYYNSFEIKFNKDHINEEWKNESIGLMLAGERREAKESLNNDVQDRIVSNAKVRHKKSVLTKSKGYRRKKEYVAQTKKLTKILIEKDCHISLK